ncbi:MAG: adenylate cyclase, partial [Gammaproteobacteria bacterium]
MHPVPHNESNRLMAVEAYQITDTPAEISYDDIAEQAAEICECPVGLINIIGDTQEWLKAKYGLPPNLAYLPRGTVCSTAICQNELLTVSDLRRDERFADHPTVTEDPNFRFYSGMPLINDDGHVLGTVCVFDFEPRELNRKQLESLRRLSRQTMAHLELRRKIIELSGARQALEAAESRSNELLLNILPESIAEELRSRNKVEPRYYDTASVLFTDFEGFTHLAENAEPRALINDLDQFFSAFDQIINKHGLEKIKTMGDAYLCVGGVPEYNTTHARDVCNAALDIQDYVTRVNRQRQRMRMTTWELR